MAEITCLDCFASLKERGTSGTIGDFVEFVYTSDGVTHGAWTSHLGETVWACVFSRLWNKATMQWGNA